MGFSKEKLRGKKKWAKPASPIKGILFFFFFQLYCGITCTRFKFFPRILINIDEEKKKGKFGIFVNFFLIIACIKGIMCLYRLNIHVWNNFFRFLFWKKVFFNFKSRKFLSDCVLYKQKFIFLHYGDLSQFFKNRVAYLLLYFIYHQAKKKLPLYLRVMYIRYTILCHSELYCKYIEIMMNLQCVFKPTPRLCQYSSVAWRK